MTDTRRARPRAGVAPAHQNRTTHERATHSRTARWRVATRLARRQVRRTWVSSLLIMALIALPIAGMAGLAVYANSMIGTTLEKVDAELGQMQAWVQPAGAPDAGMWQVPDNPHWTGYGEGTVFEVPEGEVPATPISALPKGTETVELSSGKVRIDTAAGVASVPAWAGEVTHAAFAGRFALVDGRAPENDNEVLVSPATLARTDSRIGGALNLASGGGSGGAGEKLTITGTFTAVGLPDSESAVAFFDADRLDVRQWFLPDLRLSWADVQALNAHGVIAYSRDVVLDPPAFVRPDGGTSTSLATQELYGIFTLVAMLAAAGIAAAYMVVMLAGAAFAVSTRRQQRALAIAASVGADTRDLRRTVRLQGTVLGLIGGALGLAVGVGFAVLVIRLTDDGSATKPWGLHVPWAVLLGILVFAVLVGTASALAPARGVARSDTMSALRGARRPQKVTAARPVWGSVLIVVGVGVTIFCGLAAAAVTVTPGISGDSPLRWLPIIGMIGGPIIAQLGIILSGRWLLWLASRALSKLGIAARIASRDAVANGARTVPAFAAIAATVFVGVFAVGAGTMSTGQTARAWSYSAPVGTAAATLYAQTEEGLTSESAGRVATEVAAALEEAGATATAVVARQNPSSSAATAADIPADLMRAAVLRPERNLLSADASYIGYSELSDPTNNIAVVAADDVQTVAGIHLTDAQRAAYEAGAALVTSDLYVTDGRIEVGAWTERQWNFGGAPGNLFEPRPMDDAVSAPQWTQTLDAIVIDAPKQAIVVAIAPETARGLGLQTLPRVVFGTFPPPITAADNDRLQSFTQSGSGDAFGVSAWIESGPPASESWLVPLLAAVAALVLGASAVALGLARFERRPDDATLAAVGATAGLRRRIGFWQALVIAGFGTLAGAAAGILPVIAFWLQSRTAPQGPMDLADIPWWLLIALAIALPLVIAIANWAIPPRHPDLTRRTAIA